MKSIQFIFIFLLFSSCIPFKKEPVQEKYVGNSKLPSTFKESSPVQADLQIQLEKELEWNKIVEEAVVSYEEINPLITKKCASCHDSDKPLPFYGKIFPEKNIFKKHRDDGLDNVDFSRKFPLKAKGDPSQVAILKAIRASVVERTMPIKLYTRFYPRRKISLEDEQKILSWIDPLIQRIEDFNQRYDRTVDESVEGKVSQVFEQSCNRCHGNGNERGGFGGLQDLKKMAASKFVNINEPEKSELYTLVRDGLMPPSKSQRLEEAEVQIVLDWIRSLKK
jgi:hypothetical protein